MPQIHPAVFLLILVAVAAAAFVAVSLRRRKPSFTFGTRTPQTIGERFWAEVDILDVRQPCLLSAKHPHAEKRLGVWVPVTALRDLEGQTVLELTINDASGDWSPRTPVLAVYDPDPAKQNWVASIYDGQEEREFVPLEQLNNRFAYVTVFGHFKVSEAPFTNANSFE